MDKELGVPRLERGLNRERPTPLTLASTLSRGRVNAESTEGELGPEAGGLFLEAQPPALCHKAEGTTMSTKADNHDHEKTKRAALGHWPAERSSWEGEREGGGFDPRKGGPATIGTTGTAMTGQCRQPQAPLTKRLGTSSLRRVVCQVASAPSLTARATSASGTTS